MKNIKKTKNNLFLIALMMSILFVPGILMIIFGFINHIIFIGVIGIIIVVIDFYGLPIVWMRFGEYNYYYRLFYQITVEKINYVTLLAQTNQRKKDKLLADIHFLIGKGYLTNYILKDNERLIDLSQADDKGEYIASFMNDITIIKCPNCGATCKISDHIHRCNYCCTLLDKKSTTKL